MSQILITLQVNEALMSSLGTGWVTSCKYRAMKTSSSVFLFAFFYCFIYFKMYIVECTLHYFGYWMENNRQVHIQTTGWGTCTLLEVKPFFSSASKALHCTLISFTIKPVLLYNGN